MASGTLYGPTIVPKKSAYKSKTWRCKLDWATADYATYTRVTISVTFQTVGGGDWGQVGKYLRATGYINGAQKITFNGESWAVHSGEDKYCGTGYTDIQRTHGNQSISISGSVWLTSESAYDNGTSSASGSVSVPVKASYGVYYNANGGTGAPGGQTKWYNENLTLSSTKPTRAGYAFSGWNTNSAGTGTNYASGGTYSANEGVTLYAKWTPYKVTIRYNTNGGTVETDTTQATRWRAVNGVLQLSTNSGASWTNVTTEVKTGDAHHDMWNVGTPPIKRIGHYVEGTAAWNTKADGTGVNLNQDDYSTNTVNCVTTVRLNGGSHLTGNKTVDVYPKWIRRYTVYVKVNGAWQLVEPKIKVNGTWKEAEAIYVKDGGAWKE